MGHLGGDPEVRYTAGGKPVANFSLATTERFTDKATGERQEETQWHRVVAWGKLAEICSQYLHKGNRIYLEGKLVYRKWEDDSGVSRTSADIRLTSMVMLDSKRPDGSTGDIPF
jgi:single-strand DNA-binding protein